jgi:hypothetical protein
MNGHTIVLEPAIESIDWPLEMADALDYAAEQLALRAAELRARVPERPGGLSRVERMAGALRGLATLLDPERQQLMSDEERAELRPMVASLVHALVDCLGR